MNRLRLACAGMGLALGLCSATIAAADGKWARTWDQGSRAPVVGHSPGQGARLVEVNRGGWHYHGRGRYHRGGYSRGGYYPRSSVAIYGSFWLPLGYPYYGWPYAYPYAGWPYYGYAPPVTVVEPIPEAAITAQPPAPSWYYCPESKAYYPYVTECPRGWENVPATPAEKK